MNNNEHFKTSEIEGYLKRSLPTEDRDRLETHLLFCDGCRKLLPPPTIEEMWAAIMTDTFEDDIYIPEITQNPIWNSILASWNARLNMVLAAGVLVIVFGISLVFLLVHETQPDDAARLMESNQLATNIDNEFHHLPASDLKQTNPVEINSVRASIKSEKPKKDPSKTKFGVKPSKNQSVESKPSRKNVQISETRGTTGGCQEDKSLDLDFAGKNENIVFRWNKVPKAVKYQIYISDDNEVLLEEFETENETTYILKKELEPHKIYQWKIIITLENGKNLVNSSSKFTIKTLNNGLIKSGRKQSSDVRCLGKI